jgi:hypothetical protein
MNTPNDGLFREHLSQLAPGATRLTATRYDGTHRCQSWLTILVPVVSADCEIPKPIYCLSELREETLENASLMHYVASRTSSRWTEYGPARKEFQSLSTDLPDVPEIRREVAGGWHDRFVELVWRSHLEHTRKAIHQS